MEDYGLASENGNEVGIAPSFGRGFRKKQIEQPVGGLNGERKVNFDSTPQDNSGWNDDAATSAKKESSSGWQPSNDDGWNDNSATKNSGDGWGPSFDSAPPRGGGFNSRGGGGNGGSRGACYKCHEEGHMSRDCPQGGSGGNKGCFKCNEEGHMARDCPNPGAGRSGGGGGSRACYNCGQEGHNSRDCTEPRKSNRACKNCGQEGHIARNCPDKANDEGGFSFGGGSSGGFGNSDGFGGSSGGGGSGQTCNRCKKEGHKSSECTEKVIAEDGRELVMPYIPPDYTSDENALFLDTCSSGINFDKYDKIKVTVDGRDDYKKLETFDTDELSQLLRDNIRKMNYSKPTPIQKTCIPILIDELDVMACAQTGSGKTAAFMVPIVNYLIKNETAGGSADECQQPVAVIISPTRELAIQIHKEAVKFSHSSIVKCALVYGGATTGHQLRLLQRGCHILVATVGRLKDFVSRGKVAFDRLKFFVLDEADRMLDMGFESEIKEFFAHSTMPQPQDRQTLMFSATFPPNIQKLARSYLKDKYKFVVAGTVGAANSDVRQTIEQVERKEKKNRLLELLKEFTRDGKKVLVFVESKRSTDFIACFVSQNDVIATSIHGDRLQRERETALNDFKTGKMQVLIATAVAARGLDIQGVDYVINFDLPKEIDEYVHRIGRTGRVGNTGTAISFFESGKDENLANQLVKILADANQEVPEWLQQMGSGYGGGGSDNYSMGFGASRDIRGQGGFESMAGNQAVDEGWD